MSAASQSVDIGGGTLISIVYARGKSRGLIEQHINPRGFVCMSYVKFFRPDDSHTLDRETFEVVQEDPLTILSAIRCATCGRVGYITGGKWVAET